MSNIHQVGENTVLGKILKYKGQLSCETPAQRLQRLAIPLNINLSAIEGKLRIIYSTLESEGDIIEQLSKSVGEAINSNDFNLASSILETIESQPKETKVESKLSYGNINSHNFQSVQNTQNNQEAIFTIPGYKSNKVIQPSGAIPNDGYNNKAHTNIHKEDNVMSQTNGTIAEDVLKNALAEASNQNVSVQGVVAAGVAPTAKKAKLTAKKAKENQANWQNAERSVAAALGRFDIDAAKKFADDNKVEAILCTKKKNSDFVVGIGAYDDKHIAKVNAKFFYNDQVNGATLADVKKKYQDKLEKVVKTLGWHGPSQKADHIDYSGVKGQDLQLCEHHKNATILIDMLTKVAADPTMAVNAVVKDNSAPSMNAAKIKGKFMSKKEIKELLMNNSGFNIPFNGGLRAEIRLAKVTPKAGGNTSDIASYIEPKLVRAKDEATGNRTDISSVTSFVFKADRNKTGLRNFPIDGVASVKYISAIASGDGLTAGKVKSVRLAVPVQVYKAEVDKTIVSSDDVIRLGINPEGIKSGASAELTTDKNRKSLLKGLVERIAVTTIDTGATLSSNGSADKVLQYLSDAEATEKADREAAIKAALGAAPTAAPQNAAPKAEV